MRAISITACKRRKAGRTRDENKRQENYLQLLWKNALGGCRNSQEEFLHVEKEWGYFSGKDGEIQEFDICEACYDQWVKSFQIPVRTIEITELV